jgi:hypothetical protein
MNQDGRPILNHLNNDIITARNAMPLKNLTTNNEQSFEIDRKLFYKAYQPKVNYLIPQIGRSYRQKPARGIQSFVIDGAKTSFQKKWIGGNRDASKITMNRRQNATGTALGNTGPQSFNTGTDNTVRINALARVRGGGARVPVQVGAKNVQNYNVFSH